MTTTRKAMLVLVDTKANSNKFYSLELDQTGRVSKTYGRVGADGVTNYEHTGDSGFQKILDAKKRKGYKEVDVADASSQPARPRLDKSRLASVARAGLVSEDAVNDTLVADLIERIIKVNAHDILESSGGLMKVDLNGRIQTPVGLVTLRSITEATRILDQLEHAAGAAHDTLLEQYLTFVPQKVGRTRGWQDDFFGTHNTVQHQRDFLQQLRDSVTFFDAQAESAARTPADEDIKADSGFKYRLRSVPTDGDLFKSIRRRFEESKNEHHSASRLKLKRVFELVDEPGAEVYAGLAKTLGNEQQLWHGTRAANLLSILRKGLYVPPTSGSSIQIAGRMFGDGVYLSNQSSKSLMYSTGYWTRGGQETNCFMLLNDVAMGHEYRPGHGYDPQAARKSRTTKSDDGKAFNSINVRAGRGGVRNHEAIVWNVDQVRVRYLCEFDA